MNTLTSANFMNGLNQVFIPETIQTGNHHGLIAYEPVLNLGAVLNFPDEIALVSYENESSYEALLNTAEGRAYSALHWSYFNPSSSKSLAAELYWGAVAIEHAYDLHPSYAGWMEAQTQVWVSLRHPAETDSSYLERVRENLEQHRMVRKV